MTISIQRFLLIPTNDVPQPLVYIKQNWSSGDLLFNAFNQLFSILIFILLNCRDATGDPNRTKEESNKPARAANFREISWWVAFERKESSCKWVTAHSLRTGVSKHRPNMTTQFLTLRKNRYTFIKNSSLGGF